MGTVCDEAAEDRRQKVFLKSGTEFNPELEDKLAAEAERGYDLSEAMWRIRTRPLLPDSPKSHPRQEGFTKPAFPRLVRSHLPRQVGAVPQKTIRGKWLRVDTPEWEPLLNLAPDHVVDFMWMGTVRLVDGTRLQVYKHYWTRRYLHLAADGRAFAFVPKTRYEEVNPPWLLMRVLKEELDPELGYSVRQNVWPDDAEISFARSATKHRISRQRSLYVIEHCGFQVVERRRNPADTGVDTRIGFFGDDLEGVPLEVVAAERDEEDFLVIHSMNLRQRHRGLYEEACSWRKG